MNGKGEKDFAPDQISISVTFSHHASTYEEALKGGVEKVKSYINGILDATDFKPENFKTRAYSVVEKFHTNEIEPQTMEDLDKNLRRRVSDGFDFTQYANLEFDYDKTRLAKLLVISSQIPNAPMLHINFELKDIEARKRELIPLAYENAKKKAEALAAAAGKNLRDCVRVDIDSALNGNMREGAVYSKSAVFGDIDDDFEQQVKNIDETFKPDDITLSKEISCVWETSN